MSYFLIRVHSFACSVPSCTKEEEHAEPTKAAAWKILRRYGWRGRLRGPHFCPEHAKKVRHG